MRHFRLLLLTELLREFCEGSLELTWALESTSRPPLGMFTFLAGSRSTRAGERPAGTDKEVFSELGGGGWSSRLGGLPQLLLLEERRPELTNMFGERQKDSKTDPSWLFEDWDGLRSLPEMAIEDVKFHDWIRP